MIKMKKNPPLHVCFVFEAFILGKQRRKKTIFTGKTLSGAQHRIQIGRNMWLLAHQIPHKLHSGLDGKESRTGSKILTSLEQIDLLI